MYNHPNCFQYLRNDKDGCAKEVNENGVKDVEIEKEYSSDDIIDEEEAQRAKGKLKIIK